MLHVETVFDFRYPTPYPVATGIHDDESGSRAIVDLANPEKEATWDQIEQRILKVRDMFMSGTPFSCNDLKSHIRAFDLPKSYRYPAAVRAAGRKSESESVHDFLNRRLDESIKEGVAAWQILLAGANRAYLHLEDKGVSTGTKILHPTYTERFSGRHYTSGFNIQNITADSKDAPPIFPAHKGHNLFIQFDWSAADPRIASLLSGDEEMQRHTAAGTFYSELIKRRRAQGLNETKKEIKDKMFAALYAMDVEDAITTYFPTFHSWMVEKVKHLRKHGWLETILGRRFCVDEEHTERAVFNATFQGSVSHAMHSVLAQTVDLYPENLFAEIHDSIIFTSSDFQAEKIINDVSQIMLHPFKDTIDSNPALPLKVSVGREWRKWEHLRSFNE